MSVSDSAIRITLVEDDANIGRLLEQFLQCEGYAVDWVRDGATAVERIVANQPDLVVLDKGLPRLDGIQVCKRVRKAFDNGILMLTAHDSELTELAALSAGIDDFVAKPVRPQVLNARLQALLRRQRRHNSVVLDVGELRIDQQRRQACWQQQSLALSEAEFDVLALLACYSGKPLSRDELFWRLRGIAFDGKDRSMDMRISSLRAALRKVGAPELIHSIRHKGYVLTDGIEQP